MVDVVHAVTGLAALVAMVALTRVLFGVLPDAPTDAPLDSPAQGARSAGGGLGTLSPVDLYAPSIEASMEESDFAMAFFDDDGRMASDSSGGYDSSSYEAPRMDLYDSPAFNSFDAFHSFDAFNSFDAFSMFEPASSFSDFDSASYDWHSDSMLSLTDVSSGAALVWNDSYNGHSTWD